MKEAEMTTALLSLLCVILILYIAFCDKAPIAVNITIEYHGNREIRHYTLKDDNESEIIYERGANALDLITHQNGRLSSMRSASVGSAVRIQSRQNIMLLNAATKDIVKIDKYV